MHTVRMAGTLLTAPSAGGDEIRRLPVQIALLELRADRTGDIDPDRLRGWFGGMRLYTLRSVAEGGACDAGPADRHRRLLRAAQDFDLVDLEAARDLTPELLARIPPRQRVISWAGPAADGAAVQARAASVTATPARFYRIVPQARTARDGLAALRLLRGTARRDLIAFASGAAGLWSRLLSPQLGAPFVFGAVGRDGRSLAEPSLDQLVDDYGLPLDVCPRDLYGIVGSPVTHSLSPRLHNLAYRSLGLPALYVPFEEEAFDDFWRDMVGADALAELGVSLRGLTVVSPHKERARAAGASDCTIVRRADAANLIVRNGRGWRSATTDPEGVAVALSERCVALGRKTAVIGCGGAGRAVAAALDELGADVMLVNRGLERGRVAQHALRLPFTPLASFSPDDYATIVNATPVGRGGESLPFGIGGMRTGGSIVDLAYGREPTPLIQQARARGLTAVDGLEVCLIQARHQFRLMTGHDMPRAGMTAAPEEAGAFAETIVETRRHRAAAG